MIDQTKPRRQAGSGASARPEPLRVLPGVDSTVESSYFAAIGSAAGVDLLPVALASTVVYRAQADRPDAIVIATEEFAGTEWRNSGTLRAVISATPTILLAGEINASLRARVSRYHISSLLPLDVTREQLLAAIRATVAGLTVSFEPPWAVEGDDEWMGTEERFAEEAEHLTARETAVLRLMALGHGNKEIAARLEISEHTAKFHVSSVLAKLGAASRTEAVTLGIMRGLVAI